jgi:WD40 repeat protein
MVAMNFYLWAVDGRADPVKFEGNLSWANSHCFSPDGQKIIAIDTRDRNVLKSWNPGSTTTLLEYRGHKGSINSACFSHDGKKILTTAEDSTVKIWDAESGAVLASISPGKNMLYAPSRRTIKSWSPPLITTPQAFGMPKPGNLSPNCGAMLIMGWSGPVTFLLMATNWL